MKRFDGASSVTINAPADAVFEVVTNIESLPRWNRAIESVVDEPEHLDVGATWTVQMHPPRSPRWGSVSRVEVLDPVGHTFVYETRNTDGNPSSVQWTWNVKDCDGGCEVAVSWACHLRTLDRRLLAGPIRKRALGREVPQSLARLTQLLGSKATFADE